MRNHSTFSSASSRRMMARSTHTSGSSKAFVSICSPTIHSCWTLEHVQITIPCWNLSTTSKQTQKLEVFAVRLKLSAYQAPSLKASFRLPSTTNTSQHTPLRSPASHSLAGRQLCQAPTVCSDSRLSWAVPLTSCSRTLAGQREFWVVARPTNIWLKIESSVCSFTSSRRLAT